MFDVLERPFALDLTSDLVQVGAWCCSDEILKRLAAVL